MRRSTSESEGALPNGPLSKVATRWQADDDTWNWRDDQARSPSPRAEVVDASGDWARGQTFQSKEGWLLKRWDKNKRRGHTADKRWFVLKPNALVYDPPKAGTFAQRQLRLYC